MFYTAQQGRNDYNIIKTMMHKAICIFIISFRILHGDWRLFIRTLETLGKLTFSDSIVMLSWFSGSQTSCQSVAVKSQPDQGKMEVLYHCNPTFSQQFLTVTAVQRGMLSCKSHQHTKSGIMCLILAAEVSNTSSIGYWQSRLPQIPYRLSLQNVINMVLTC